MATGVEFSGGEIVAIPLGDGDWVAGQVIVPATVCLLVVFDRVHAEPPALDEVDDADPALVFWTTGAQRDWRVIGQRPVRAECGFAPLHTALRHGTIWVFDRFGEAVRPAGELDRMTLSPQVSLSPAAARAALKAHFKRAAIGWSIEPFRAGAQRRFLEGRA